MFTINEYIESLKSDKLNLVNNLLTKGITATSEETFTTLVPKVLDITVVNNQTKSETITSNGTTTISPDTGYTGLSSIEITTNVQTDMSDYFTSTIGSGTNTDSGVNRMIKKLPSNITVNGTSLAYAFANYHGEIPMVDTSNVTDMTNCFNMCQATSMPLWNTSNVTTMQNMFYSCFIETIPALDTSNVTTMQNMFSSSRVVNLPVLNTSKVTNMAGMFEANNRYTDTSLDNILQMCIGATSYTGTKTLYYLGFRRTNYSQSRIEALPHYQDFIDAGWTIGY